MAFLPIGPLAQRIYGRITSGIFFREGKMFEGLLQPMHLLLILIIALAVFGPGKLPELGGALGKGIKEFKKALAEGEKELQSTGKNSTESTPEEKK
jgi:sec-independent protein translocase protein TatA